MVAFVILFITFIVAFFALALGVLFRNNFKMARFFGLVSSINFIISMAIGAFH